MTTRQIDYTQFDGLIAEQLIISQLGGERMRVVILDLIGQGASKGQITGRLLELLPTWTGTANQLDVVVDWLMSGGGDLS
jgi:hypothetical protein